MGSYVTPVQINELYVYPQNTMYGYIWHINSDCLKTTPTNRQSWTIETGVLI